MEERYYILFKGRVQGVGFRYFIYQKALKYHLTGYVRNLYSGDVEAYIQGEKTAIDNFLVDVLHNSDRFIRIDDYWIKKVAPIEDDCFEVRY